MIDRLVSLQMLSRFHVEKSQGECDDQIYMLSEMHHVPEGKDVLGFEKS